MKRLKIILGIAVFIPISGFQSSIFGKEMKNNDSTSDDLMAITSQYTSNKRTGLLNSFLNDQNINHSYQTAMNTEKEISGAKEIENEENLEKIELAVKQATSDLEHARTELAYLKERILKMEQDVIDAKNEYARLSHEMVKKYPGKERVNIFDEVLKAEQRVSKSTGELETLRKKEVEALQNYEAAHVELTKQELIFYKISRLHARKSNRENLAENKAKNQLSKLNKVKADDSDSGNPNDQESRRTLDDLDASISPVGLFVDENSLENKAEIPLPDTSTESGTKGGKTRYQQDLVKEVSDWTSQIRRQENKFYRELRNYRVWSNKIRSNQQSIKRIKKRIKSLENVCDFTAKKLENISKDLKMNENLAGNERRGILKEFQTANSKMKKYVRILKYFREKLEKEIKRLGFTRKREADSKVKLAQILEKSGFKEHPPYLNYYDKLLLTSQNE